MIEEGTILQKRYRIEKPIGQGGMGAVFLATDDRFGSKVAIKETFFSDAHYQKAFKREARLLNSLKHSALPKVSDHFVENNGQYIVMEYIGGADLFDEMENRGAAFSYDDVLNWTHQLLDALEYLHNQENPVIHRDIKPQNLKLTSDGRIILLDFGLAKGNPTDANHKTAANSIFGYSRNYASLEQIQGTGTDPRSDIYSLGATMYHLVTGSPPSDALTRVMLVLNEEKDSLLPADEVYEQVPAGFSQLLQRAMSLNANVRPQSTMEMREMLAEIAETGKLNSPGENSESGKIAAFASPNRTSAKSEMKTEVLPSAAFEQDSIKTKIVQTGTSAGGKRTTKGGGAGMPAALPNRNRRVLTSVLGGSVLVGSLVAGVYFVKPSLFGKSPLEIDNVGSKPVKLNSVKTTSDMELSDTNSIDLDANTDTAENQTPTNTSTIVSAPVKSKKPKTTEKKDKNTKEKSQLAENKGEVKITDGKVVTKASTVTKGKIKTGNVIVNGKELKIKQGKIPRKLRIPMTREEYSKLTPAQKRKLRIFMERKKRLDRRRENRRRRPPPGRRPPPPRKPKQ